LITSLTKAQIGPNSWLLTAVSDTPGNLFYWWKDGVYLGSTISGQRTFTITSGSPQISVFDDSGDAPEIGLPDYLKLQWSHDGLATQYHISHMTTPELETLLEFTMDATNKKQFEFTTPALQDSKEHLFTITAIRHGSSFTGRTIYHTMVRRPDAPTLVSDSFDEGTGVLDLEVA
jgi:hypothetical protein